MPGRARKPLPDYSLPEHDVTTFGRQLTCYRTRANMSRLELSERCKNASHSYIGRLENGNRNPSWEVIEQIAKGLDLTRAEHDLLLFHGGFRTAPHPTFDAFQELYIQASAEIQKHLDVGLEVLAWAAKTKNP